MPRVRLVPRAARQAKRIDEWWRENRLASPDLFAEELASAIEALAAAPEIGSKYDAMDVPGIRRLLLRATQFHAYYDFDGTTVRVLAVWSCHRGRSPSLG